MRALVRTFIATLSLGLALPVGAGDGPGSDAERLAWADDALAQMQQAVLRAEQIEVRVHRAADAGALGCVSERVVALRAITGVSSLARDGIARAAAAGQASRVDHEARKIAVALGKASEMLGEVERCAGEAAPPRRAPAELTVSAVLLPDARRLPPAARGEAGAGSFQDTRLDAVSTFPLSSADASYTFGRRHLLAGVLPAPETVRAEEFVNHFPYRYPQPEGDAPFAVDLEAVPSPFGAESWMVRIGVQARRAEERRPKHLTFLVDTSGSMSAADRLPLLVEMVRTALPALQPDDTVAVVTFAEGSRVVLEPTRAVERARILEALRGLHADGSTAMGEGFAEAFRLAGEARVEGHDNAVFFCTDADAESTSLWPRDLADVVRGHAERGIRLSALVFGAGNYADPTIDTLTALGRGRTHHVDAAVDGRRLFRDGPPVPADPVAEGAGIQVAWHAEAVRSWRLIGYASGTAGVDPASAVEVPAGHSVTALYEVVLSGAGSEIATVRMRGRSPGQDAVVDQRAELTRADLRPTFASGSADLRVAVAAAAFAEALRDGSRPEELAEVRRVATRAQRPNVPEDAELVSLIRLAERMVF